MLDMSVRRVWTYLFAAGLGAVAGPPVSSFAFASRQHRTEGPTLPVKVIGES